MGAGNAGSGSGDVDRGSRARASAVDEKVALQSRRNADVLFGLAGVTFLNALWPIAGWDPAKHSDMISNLGKVLAPLGLISTRLFAQLAGDTAVGRDVNAVAAAGAAAIFVILGLLAYRGRDWAMYVAIAVYALDVAVALAVPALVPHQLVIGHLLVLAVLLAAALWTRGVRAGFLPAMGQRMENDITLPAVVTIASGVAILCLAVALLVSYVVWLRSIPSIPVIDGIAAGDDSGSWMVTAVVLAFIALVASVGGLIIRSGRRQLRRTVKVDAAFEQAYRADGQKID